MAVDPIATSSFNSFMNFQKANMEEPEKLKSGQPVGAFDQTGNRTERVEFSQAAQRLSEKNDVRTDAAPPMDVSGLSIDEVNAEKENA